MGHHNMETHGNNSYLSKYGRGFKRACFKFGNKIEIYTKSFNDETNEYDFLKITYDILFMSNQCQPGQDREPKFEVITEEEFHHIHKYDYGTTTRISEFGKNTQIPSNTYEVIKITKQSLSECFASYIKEKRISVYVGLFSLKNNKLEKIDYKRSPFDIINYPHKIFGFKIFILKNEDNDMENAKIYVQKYNIINGEKKYEHNFRECNFTTTRGIKNKLSLQSVTTKKKC